MSILNFTEIIIILKIAKMVIRSIKTNFFFYIDADVQLYLPPGLKEHEHLKFPLVIQM